MQKCKNLGQGKAAAVGVGSTVNKIDAVTNCKQVCVIERALLLQGPVPRCMCLRRRLLSVVFGVSQTSCRSQPSYCRAVKPWLVHWSAWLPVAREAWAAAGCCTNRQSAAAQCSSAISP